jgi:hypothetical protein
MSVKLYNLSGLPDEPLRSLLVKAKRAARCGGSVIVKVTRGGRRVTSHAKSANFVYQWFLLTRRRTKKDYELKERRVQTSGGYIVMQPYRGEPLASAERFFETAIHEFHHVKEFQEGGKFRHKWSFTDGNGRRPVWEKRPEEIRAVNATDEALGRLRRRKEYPEDAVIALALQMEAKWKS